VKDQYLCVHGHFYQPPRENPWLEAIEYQASAHPYHDWNERITRECYAPNARARVYGHGGRILKLINNYAYMSFNFGPTLLLWLEKAFPWVYSQILAADQASRARCEGHGNAMAQVYNHIIMPLAKRRDKLTQIRWGQADFKHRFGELPEGMWLAETAVDSETLELMAREGVKFTILSPTQAQSIRPLGGETSWQDVSGGKIDTTRPYRVYFDKSGNSFIDVFFYEGSISKAVAYEKILTSGNDFLARIDQAFGRYQDGPRLVNVATDGESYGHHFKFGDLALSWLFNHLEESEDINLMNYACYLERFPPKNEVKIFENSSWSCPHGVERWRSDCGCNVGHTPGWTQAWRAPLREGLDWLAGELETVFEEQGARLFRDPWGARDDYISVFLHPSAHHRDQFLKRHAKRPLGAEKKVEALQLLESQRMSLYMFTSCGWFFDEISGLEATQVLKYAARALSLAQPWAKNDLEAGLIEFLAKAKSNDPDYGNGGRVYQDLVRPSWIEPSRAVAHYALASLVDDSDQRPGGFFDLVSPVRKRRLEAKDILIILGESKVAEPWTGKEFKRTYLALAKGGAELSCFVGESGSLIHLNRMIKEIRQALSEETCEKVKEIFCRYQTPDKSYGLDDLIPDVRRGLIQALAHSLGRHIKNSIRERHTTLKGLLAMLQDTDDSAPKIIGLLLPIFIPDEIERQVVMAEEGNTLDWSGLRDLVARSRPWNISLNDSSIGRKCEEFLHLQMKQLAQTPNRASMENIIRFLDLAHELDIDFDNWHCQNMFYDLYVDPLFNQRLAMDLSGTFLEIGRHLGFLLQGE